VVSPVAGISGKSTGRADMGSPFGLGAQLLGRRAPWRPASGSLVPLAYHRRPHWGRDTSGATGVRQTLTGRPSVDGRVRAGGLSRRVKFADLLSSGSAGLRTRSARTGGTERETRRVRRSSGTQGGWRTSPDAAASWYRARLITDRQRWSSACTGTGLADLAVDGPVGLRGRSARARRSGLTALVSRVGCHFQVEFCDDGVCRELSRWS